MLPRRAGTTGLRARGRPAGVDVYPVAMRNEAERSLVALEPGMQTALGQAWASIRGGSLGIGAAAYEVDGTFVASGRNRLLETDPGDDVLAGSSLAHAELNVLAKLGYRRHDSLRLFTTLQPCVQCLGAIRLSTVATVVVLAPDPLFRGVERMRELTPFLGRSWPAIEQLPITPWSAFALLYPTRHSLDHPTLGPVWTQALPTTAEVARAAPAAIGDTESMLDAAALLWDQLELCVPEITTLAST